jgi:hypothetical protein
MPFWSSTESKIKVVVLFKGDTKNQCWYSPIKHNNLPDTAIIQSMLNRLKGKIAGFHKIHCYDNKSNSLIYVIE